MDAPLRSLVASQLRPIHEKSGLADTEFQLATFDDAVAIGAEAIAGSGVGLDAFAGERILCGALLRLTPRGHEHRLALAITDRRTAVGGWSDIKGNFNGKRLSIPHTDLQRLDSKTGLLSTYLGLVTAAGKHEVPLSSTAGIQMLDGFYRAMLGGIAPAQRIEPPSPFPVATEQDPTAARVASQALWSADPGTLALLQRLDGAAREGQLTREVASDLVMRLTLANRARSGGPGMWEGGWISPMSALDLGHTLIRIYGPPRAAAEPQPGVYSADFELDPRRRDPLVDYVDGLGLASYYLLGYGFSPASIVGGAIGEVLMRKDPVRQLRFLFRDRPGYAVYQVQTPGRVLEDHDAAMAHRIHQVLLHLSGRVLERRCAVGWSPSYDELFPPA